MMGAHPPHQMISLPSQFLQTVAPSSSSSISGNNLCQPQMVSVVVKSLKLDIINNTSSNISKYAIQGQEPQQQGALLFALQQLL